MVKHAIFGVIAVFVISVIAVLGLSSSMTGNTAYGGYGYSNKLYGPGLKNALKHNPLAFGVAFEKQAYIAKNQAYMLDNKDKWVCGLPSSDGPQPCMPDEKDSSGKTWCCMPSPVSTASLSGPAQSTANSGYRSITRAKIVTKQPQLPH